MKKIIRVLLAMMLVFTSIIPVSASGPGVSAKYAIAVDSETGAVLYEKNARVRMNPASITKILTCLVAVEHIDDLDATVTITQRDLDTVWETGASAANFEVGEVVTYRDLLMGAMLPSGADACRALAFNVSGSQEAFVEEMNEFCKEKLGLNDTHFVNTTGIHDDDHYTTVYDMAMITQYALKNDKFREVFERYQFNSSNGRHQWIKKVLYNAKRGRIDVSRITGCKSGYTDKAKHTLASSVDINGHECIVVVGKSEKSGSYQYPTVSDTLAIANYLERNFEETTVYNEGEEFKQAKVVNGEKSKVDTYLSEDVILFLPKGYDKDDITYKVSMKELTAPVKKDQKAGTLKVYYKDELLSKKTLKTSHGVKEDEMIILLRKIKNFMIPYGIIGIVVFFVLLLIVRRIMIIRRRRRRRRNMKKRG